LAWDLCEMFCWYATATLREAKETIVNEGRSRSFCHTGVNLPVLSKLFFHTSFCWLLKVTQRGIYCLKKTKKFNIGICFTNLLSLSCFLSEYCMINTIHFLIWSFFHLLIRSPKTFLHGWKAQPFNP
jgi:hypothetical protein